MAASVSPAEEIRDLFPSRSFPGELPYPLYAVLEPQLPPDGFLLLEELLQRLRQRRRRGDLRAHDSGGLEPATLLGAEPAGAARSPCHAGPCLRHGHGAEMHLGRGLGEGVGATPRGAVRSSPEEKVCLFPQQAKDNVLPMLRAQRGMRQHSKRCPVPRDELSLQNQSLNHPTCRKGSL